MGLPFQRRDGVRSANRPLFPSNRKQRGNLFLVLRIDLSELPLQRTFLKPDAYQDIQRHPQRKEQPINSHQRSGPECDQEATHQRVSHNPVEKWKAELWRHWRLAANCAPDLLEAK